VLGGRPIVKRVAFIASAVLAFVGGLVLATALLADEVSEPKVETGLPEGYGPHGLVEKPAGAPGYVSAEDGLIAKLFCEAIRADGGDQPTCEEDPKHEYLPEVYEAVASGSPVYMGGHESGYLLKDGVVRGPVDYPGPSKPYNPDAGVVPGANNG
jgi:hypothetical protein